MIALNSHVKVTAPCDGKSSIQYETGKVIYVGRRYLVQFDSNICGHDGNGIGKNRYCWMVDIDKVKELNQ